MKIVYFGSDVFLDVFQYLHQNHEILALYTYHMEEDYFNERNITLLAHAAGIPIHYDQITEDAMLDYMDRCDCELFFIAEYSHKIPTPNHPLFRGVNIHSSMLPEGRSYYPIECAMNLDHPQSGVTVQKIASTLDGGDILSQRCYDILPKDDSVDIYLKCGRLALEMSKALMENFESVWTAAISQSSSLPYWKRPGLESMSLHHGLTAEEAKEKYRRFNKMTTVNIDGMFYYIDSFATGSVVLGERDGDVFFLRDDRVLYGVVDGHLRLDLVPMGDRGSL